MIEQMLHDLLVASVLFTLGYVVVKVISHAIRWLAGDTDEPNR